MSFGRLALVFPLMFAFVMGDKSCGINLGDIGDFVIKYDIVVTNNGSEDALISVIGLDIKAQAVVKPGASVGATSYQGGTLIVFARSAVDHVAQLKQQAQALEAQIALGPSNPNFLFVHSQLFVINSQITAAMEGGHTGSCTSQLKPDEHGKGGEYDFQASGSGTSWTVTGLCGA